MDKQYIINWQGKDFVLYEGLLHEAHQRGLQRIETYLQQAPSDTNGQTAICKAEVELADGVRFTGIGDANAGNVNRKILPHIIRMAETRAKARALRDALDIGATAFEELSDGDTDAPTTPEGVNRTTGQKGPDRVRDINSGKGRSELLKSVMGLCEELAPLRGKGEDKAKVLREACNANNIAVAKTGDLSVNQLSTLLSWLTTQRDIYRNSGEMAEEQPAEQQYF